MLKAEKAATNGTKNSKGVVYEVKETEYVDLSKDNELSKRLTGLRGSTKYKAIRDYILEALGDLDWVSIEGTLMSYYIPYHYYLNEHFLCFKKYSGRFVDYYQGDIHRKIVDDGKSFVQKTKFFKETWLPNNIEISLSPLN